MRLIDADALKARFTEELFERSGLSAQGIIDEAPTIEPSGDLISRADAVNTLETEIRCTDRGEDVSGLTLAKSLIDALPSADAEHDGCDGCRYEHNTEYEYPCSECKQNHVDMWEQKPNDFIDVVRCKDCKHLKTMCEDEGTCYYWCKHWNNATDDWGHCYYGERREP